MQDKEKLSMYVDIIKITIIICWVSLVAFWLLKIFGGNLFEIMVENENFLKFSELVQNSWLKYLVSFFTIVSLKYLSICAICQRFYFKNKDFVILVCALIANWAVVNFVPLKYSIITSNFAYIIFIIYGIVYQTNWKKLFGLLAVVFDFAFSTISMIVRDIDLQVITDYLVLLILCIDIYIMTGLYYLYSNLIRIKKENNYVDNR